MELASLYSIAERESIHIINAHVQNSKAMVCQKDDIKAILMDYHNIDTTVEEKCILAEELAHCLYGATYSQFCADECLIRREEYRAKKQSMNQLVPYSDLRNAINKGLQYKWEIAEELCVTEDIVEKAMLYYKTEGLAYGEEER